VQFLCDWHLNFLSSKISYRLSCFCCNIHNTVVANSYKRNRNNFLHVPRHSYMLITSEVVDYFWLQYHITVIKNFLTSSVTVMLLKLNTCTGLLQTVWIFYCIIVDPIRYYLLRYAVWISVKWIYTYSVACKCQIIPWRKALTITLTLVLIYLLHFCTSLIIYR